MTSEEAQAVSTRNVPHADCAITRASEDVQVVGMESYAVDIGIMSDIYAERLNMVC
jgi:hypothetical protein